MVEGRFDRSAAIGRADFFVGSVGWLYAMSDFDANDDPLRLTGAGNDEPLDPAEIRPRVMRRARQLAYGQCYARRARSQERVGVTLPSQRRRAARRACPHARRVPMLGTPLRRRRRLWTVCHGRPPGSPS